VAARTLRTLLFLHRWLGVALCLLFLSWFCSGIVLMYRGYPEVGTREHRAKDADIDVSKIRITPAEAYASLELDRAPDQARITMLGGRPVYRFRTGRSQAAIFADDGTEAAPIGESAARRIATEWTGKPAPRFESELNEADQWTVQGSFRALEPLYKYSWPDGEQVYVSSQTAEVVQRTTSASRMWAWLGAIPHWLYFTPLRKDTALWSTVVIWASGAATAMSVLGLAIGLWMYRPSKPLPYAGFKRWHLAIGLIFGIPACAWAFSGMLSMDPIESLSRPDENAPRVSAALRGARLKLSEFASMPHIQGREIEMTMFAGEPFFLVWQSESRSQIVPVHGAPAGQFDASRVAAALASAGTISETRLVTQYETFYLDRSGLLPLPALFVRLGGAMYYIDLKTARVAASYSDASRWNRFLYHGLHSWDAPWLYRSRPSWDVLVILFMLGGVALSMTSVVLAVQVLMRKVSPPRP
jgi:hypothetical protein